MRIRLLGGLLFKADGGIDVVAENSLARIQIAGEQALEAFPQRSGMQSPWQCDPAPSV
jgi:hypothetical protein